jgi:hypothetical protein
MRGWFRGLGLLQPTIVLDDGQVPFWPRDEPEQVAIQRFTTASNAGRSRCFRPRMKPASSCSPITSRVGRREGFYFTRHLSFTTPFRALNPTILAERLGKLR